MALILSQEWRHAHGMRCLGIPNTAHFANVTLIEDAVACNVDLFYCYIIRHRKILKVSTLGYFPNLQPFGLASFVGGVAESLILGYMSRRNFGMVLSGDPFGILW